MVSVLSLMGDRGIRERSDNTNIQHNNHRISFKLFGTVYLLKLRKNYGLGHYKARIITANARYIMKA